MVLDPLQGKAAQYMDINDSAYCPSLGFQYKQALREQHEVIFQPTVIKISTNRVKLPYAFQQINRTTYTASHICRYLSRQAAIEYQYFWDTIHLESFVSKTCSWIFQIMNRFLQGQFARSIPKQITRATKTITVLYIGNIFQWWW